MLSHRDNKTAELYANVEQISIKKDLYIRLAKTKVIPDVDIAEIEKSADEEVKLSKEHSGWCLNGLMFGKYLVVVRKIMKYKENQIFNIKVE